MAIAARLYGPYDGAFAARCLAASQQAWAWLLGYPNVVFRNCCGVSTGEYGDDDCSDEILWAAAELYRSTGESTYHDYFLAKYLGQTPTVAANWPQGWSDVRQMAMFTYYFSGQPSANATARARIRADTLAAADTIATRTTAEPYCLSLAPAEYVWGSNGVVANYGVLLLLAYGMNAKPAYLEAALDDLHYLFGRNTFGLSWVTQLGDNPFRHPHHRPSGSDSQAEPWPGLLSGGPNRYGGDPVIDALPEQPPARRYKDDQNSYASNEVAINWNAPLVFLLAGANAQ
jgi:endoglucanase